MTDDDNSKNESRAPSDLPREQEGDLAAQLARQGLSVSAADLVNIATAFGHMATRIERLRALEGGDCEGALQFRVAVREAD